MKYLALTSVLALSVLALGCKETVYVVNPGNAHSGGTVFLKIDSSPAGITQVVARLTRDGFNELQLNLTISDSSSSASGSFENVAIGVWHLRVDALDESNVVRYTGDEDVEVFSGETTHADLELFSASGNIEIHVTWRTHSPISGLMLYMPFDGSLIDSSGNSNHGGSPKPEYVADRLGSAGRAYKFNGVDNFITIPNSASLNPTNAITIAFWFRVDSVAWNVSQLVSKTDSDFENLREYVVELKANYDYPYFKLWAAATGDGSDELDAGAALLYEWHHFVGIVDRKVGHAMSIYLDGALSDSLNDTSTGFVVNSHPLYLGAGEGGWETESVPNCAMDDLRIYSRALSPAEVLALYNQH